MSLPTAPTATSSSRTAGSALTRPLRATSTFVGETVHELRQVTWPTWPEVVRYTAIVIAFLVVMTALIASADTGIGVAVSKVFAG